MKIWFISDTHTFHRNLVVPDVDLIIHSGDEANKSHMYENELESRDFFNWYRTLPGHKIFVPGNHSTAIFNNLVQKEDYPEIEFLIHKETIFNGFKIFGSPYTPSYGESWAYMRKRNQMSVVWENIPKVDILITHGPPKSILDLTRDRESNNLVQAGCKSLYNKVLEIKPKIHCFGHIHEETDCRNSGILQVKDTTFINAACLNHKDKLFYNGFVLEV